MSWTQSQLTKLKEDAFKFGIELNEKQLHQFIKYYEQNLKLCVQNILSIVFLCVKQLIVPRNIM